VTAEVVDMLVVGAGACGSLVAKELGRSWSKSCPSSNDRSQCLVAPSCPARSRPNADIDMKRKSARSRRNPADANADPTELATQLATVQESLRQSEMRVRELTELLPDHWYWERAHGCDEVQGFFVAQPMDASACTRALQENCDDHAEQR
jgi:hypothetical protein